MSVFKPRGGQGRLARNISSHPHLLLLSISNTALTYIVALHYNICVLVLIISCISLSDGFICPSHRTISSANPAFHTVSSSSSSSSSLSPSLSPATRRWLKGDHTKFVSLKSTESSEGSSDGAGGEVGEKKVQFSEVIDAEMDAQMR